MRQFLLVNALLYICCLTIYISMMLLTPAADQTLHNTTVALPPVILATCYKYMDAAKNCCERLRDLGFDKIHILNGDDVKDGGVCVPIKSSNFRATCIYMVEQNIPYILYFEEDAQLISSTFRERREHIMTRTIHWATQHPKNWDLVYLGCACVSPTIPVLVEDNLILHRSTTGHLTGHAFMFNMHVAQRYLQIKDHKHSFDNWLAREPFRTYASQLTIFTQISFDAPGFMKRTIGTNADARIMLDICVLAWTCIWITLLFVSTTILVVSIIRLRSRMYPE